MACRLLKFKLSFKASRMCLTGRVAAACERIWWYAPAAYFALYTIYFCDKQTQAMFRFVTVKHLPVVCRSMPCSRGEVRPACLLAQAGPLVAVPCG